jgi:AcrR family transcriptional regulator
MTGKATGRPGRPAASLERDARDLLLAAATDLFAVHGVAATTFAMIAKRAGLTPAMVHYYFIDRGQLLDAVVEERIAPLIVSVWGPVNASDAPAEIIRGVVERMLAGIEQMLWIPSTWMREVLNEGGLLRSRVFLHLPFNKLKLLGKSVAGGQARKAINPNLDPGLIVFSTIGLVMLHVATVRFWAEIFESKPPNIEALRLHITGLLLNGLQPEASARSVQRTRNK